MLLALISVILLSCVSVPKAGVGGPIELQGDGIVVIGDFGTGERDQYTVAQGIRAYCNSHDCSFGITVGDNFYPAGVRSVSDPAWRSKFELPYQRLNFRFYPSLGNHDYAGNAQAQIDYKSRLWNMPGRYYKLINQDAEFFAIDTERFDDAQRRWLDDALKASQATWKIVYGHHPMYSSGMHGDTWSMHKSLLPILRANKVDLYVAGHDHHLELQERDGIKHVISGAAAKVRGLKPWARPIFARSGLGFVHISFEIKHTLRINYVDAYGRVIFYRDYTK